MNDQTGDRLFVLLVLLLLLGMAPCVLYLWVFVLRAIQ